MATKKKARTESTGEVETAAGTSGNLAQIQDVDVTVSMELGGTVMTLDELLEVEDQSLIEMERAVGEPIDIKLNGKLFARGEVVTVNENFGVRVTEIVGRE